MTGKDGRADGDGHRQLAAAQIHRFLKFVDEVNRDMLGIGGIGQRGEDGGEFIAAHAGQRIGGAQAALQARRQLAEQFVAVGVAVGVVDKFEAVDVDEQNGQGIGGARRGGEGELQPIVEQSAIGKAGEGIVVGLKRQLFVELAMFVGDADQFAGELEHFDGAGVGSVAVAGVDAEYTGGFAMP